MEKLREENMSLQQSFDEVIKSGMKREAWARDIKDDTLLSRPRTSGAKSPIEWAKNADEMKVGGSNESFVLPSRALFKSL